MSNERVTPQRAFLNTPTGISFAMKPIAKTVGKHMMSEAR